MKEWLLNLWWSIKYFRKPITKEIHNGVTVCARGSGEKARGKK